MEIVSISIFCNSIVKVLSTLVDSCLLSSVGRERLKGLFGYCLIGPFIRCLSNRLSFYLYRLCPIISSLTL